MAGGWSTFLPAYLLPTPGHLKPMTVFYLKLFITPLLMLSISLAAKRWGTHIGGLLSGLPITSASVMLFLSLEQGPAFASLAVPGALAGVAAIQAAYLCYFQVTRRLPAWGGCMLALAVYAAAGMLMSTLGWLELSVVAALCLILALLYVTANTGELGQARYVAMPRWVIPMRMLTATLLLLAITAGAQWFGPQVSGLLAPIPVIAWPLTVFTHVQGGRYELATVVRGNAIGAVGVLGFYLVLKALVQDWGIVLTLALAVALAVAVTALLAASLKQQGAKAP